MKTIFPKFKINTATYFLFFLYVVTGHFKHILLIMLILLFHEFGHGFFLKLFSYEILSVEIFPFGGITKSSKLINTPIKHDLFIYFGGVFFQILLFFLFLFLKNTTSMHEDTYLLFLKYNTSIFLFNLLPIRPLDGGEILKLILENYCSYEKAQAITNRLSILFLFFFFLFNITFNLNNYVVIAYLFVKIWEFIKKERFYQNKFLLERFLYSFSYRQIRNEKKQNLNLLQKDTFHYFKEKNRYISEKELLQRKFDIHSYF